MKTSNYQDRIFQRNLEMIRALEQGFSPKQVAEMFQISVATVYNIRKKTNQAGGINALIPKSKAPKTKPAKDPMIIQLILSTRQDTDFGAEKIYDFLLANSAEYKIDPDQIPKPRTIHNILKEHGKIVHKTPQKKKFKPDYYHTRRTQRPNDIIEVDIKTDHYLEKRPVIVNGTIDICSKVATASIDTSKTALNAALNLIEHIYQWGLPQFVKTDNDMAYIGQIEGSSFGLFTRLCLLLGLEHTFIPIHSPRWNPFIESFFSSWDTEFFNRIHHLGWDALIQGNRGYIRRYNNQRSHQGLKKLSHNPDKIKFPKAYHQRYAQINFPSWKKQDLINLVKKESIPLVKGRVSFIRKIPQTGILKFKDNQFNIPKSFSGTIIKGTIFVDPDQNPFKVVFYFREHEIKMSHYYLKRYDIRALKKF
ncbi:MAG: helix-turn-helix domain-containing protein [Methanosarcinales archaeon]